MTPKINPFFYDSDAEAILALQAEGRRLQKIAEKLWREDMASYQPAMYIRTYNSQKAIKLGNVKRLDALTWGIELSFDNDLSYHESQFDKLNGTNNYKKGHSFMLISEGWAVSKGNHWGIYRFGYFEGTDYITRVIQAFNSGSRGRIALEANWQGSPFKKQKKQKNVLI